MQEMERWEVGAVSAMWEEPTCSESKGSKQVKRKEGPKVHCAPGSWLEAPEASASIFIGTASFFHRLIMNKPAQ